MQKQHEPTRSFVPIGGLFVCNCGIPLARKISRNEWEFFKFHNGMRTGLEIELDRGGVRCKICNRGFTHITVHESIRIVESLSVAERPIEGVD